MTRRLGLAAALCLTTIVGFAVIVLGRQAGFFGGGASTEAQPLAELPSATAPVPASPTPIVIEQYIYRDEYLPSEPAAGNPAPVDSSSGRTAQQPAPGGGEDAQPTATPPVRTEFNGRVAAISGSSLTVTGESGQYEVMLTSNTNVHGGALVVGVTVKVHASAQADGTLVATEIEVVQTGGEEHEGGDD